MLDTVNLNLNHGLFHFWSGLVDKIGNKNMTIKLYGELYTEKNHGLSNIVKFNGGYATVPSGIYFGEKFTFTLWIKFSNLEPQNILAFGTDGTNINDRVLFYFHNNIIQVLINNSEENIYCTNLTSSQMWF